MSCNKCLVQAKIGAVLLNKVLDAIANNAACSTYDILGGDLLEKINNYFKETAPEFALEDIG